MIRAAELSGTLKELEDALLAGFKAALKDGMPNTGDKVLTKDETQDCLEKQSSMYLKEELLGLPSL